MVDFDALVVGPCTDVFGEAVVFTANERLPQTVTGVFDRAYLELLPLGGSRGQEPRQFGAAGNITARKPILGVRLADFLCPPEQGDRIDIPARGLSFTIQEVQPDGQGAAKLLLTRAID